MLSTIDDHKKLNEKLNKHYQKRFKIVEKDLLYLQNSVNNENFTNFVGYNGIPLSGTGYNHGLLNNLAKGTNPAALMMLSSGA